MKMHRHLRAVLALGLLFAVEASAAIRKTCCLRGQKLAEGRAAPDPTGRRTLFPIRITDHGLRFTNARHGIQC
jgi:hypothetical protein